MLLSSLLFPLSVPQLDPPPPSLCGAEHAYTHGDIYSNLEAQSQFLLLRFSHSPHTPLPQQLLGFHLQEGSQIIYKFVSSLTNNTTDRGPALDGSGLGFTLSRYKALRSIRMIRGGLFFSTGSQSLDPLQSGSTQKMGEFLPRHTDYRTGIQWQVMRIQR